MKKYKYQTLSKEEKKKVTDKYFNTNEGLELKKRLNRVLIYSIILFLFGLYLLIEEIIKNDSIAQYIYSSILMIISIVFLLFRRKLILEHVNDYLVTKKK